MTTRVLEQLVMSISTKPYLIRALYDWCVDSQYTPYLVASVNEQTQVPMQYVKDNQIVLSIGVNAVKDLQIQNDWIHFNARFSGKVHDIWLPVNNIVAIYTKETGEGMNFSVEENPVSDMPPKSHSPESSTMPTQNKDEGSKAQNTHLKIIK